MKAGAGVTFHPLVEMLKAQGLPDLAESLIKDLYQSQLTYLSKDLSVPLAKSLFSPWLRVARHHGSEAY